MPLPSISKRILAFPAAILGLSIAFSSAAKAEYPERPIQLIVPNPAGGTTDVDARIIASGLQQVLGQPVVIENRPGGGGRLGTSQAAHAAADGYTLLYVGISALTINPHIYSKLDFDPINGFEPIGLGTSGKLFLYASKKFAPNSAAELVEYAKANPGKVNYGISGAGSLPQLVTELFKEKTGIKLTEIPYKGAVDAIPATVAGEIDFIFNPVNDGIAYLRSGDLKALFIMDSKRHPEFPQVPSAPEAGFPDFQFGYYSGLVAPRGTSPEIVAKLNQALNKALQIPSVKGRLTASGNTIGGGTPQEYRKLLVDDFARYGEIVRRAGIRAE